MEFLWTFFPLFGFGCFGFVPTALAAAAIVDILRVRAEWYWLFVALFVPVLGPATYFLVYYGPWANRLGRLSPAAAQRAEAKRRLRELDIQLQHWRGPSILAESGELLLGLNKRKRAEVLLREARDAGAELKEYALPLANVLQVEGGRWREALPLLEELVELEPDYKFGAARMSLARTLDELGDADRAERELRAVLVKRSPPEAKVRLARLLLRRHEGEEAARLLAEVRADAEGMPVYLRREHAPWLRAARRLKSPAASLPPPKIEGRPPAQPKWKVAAIVLGGVVAVAYIAYWFSTSVAPFFTGQQEMMEIYGRLGEVTERIDRLRGEPADKTDLAELELNAEALDEWLDFRSALQEACGAAGPPGERPSDAASDVASGAQMMALQTQNISRQTQISELVVRELELRDLRVEDLARRLALVDWRFLQRPAAAIFELPAHFRLDYMGALSMAEQEPLSVGDVGLEYKRMHERQVQEAEAKLQDFRRLVEGRAVHESTRTSLEARRQELESSLDTACLRELQGFVTGQFWSYDDEIWTE